MSSSIYSSSGFMPLSPLLCDTENSNPFLKMNTSTQSPKEETVGAINSSLSTSGGEEKAYSCKSGSSSDTEMPQQQGGTMLGKNGQTIAVNKQEMVKLIEEQNLQKQRLLRKAEQARLSRKRKKMRMQELEKESDFLRAEVKRLKAALMAKENKIAAMVSANKAISPTALSDANEYSEMFGKLEKAVDEGQNAQVAMQVDYMLRSFKNNKPDADKYVKAFAAQISPSLPVRFLEWILNKHEGFYEDKNGLWYSLFAEESGLTMKQMAEMKDLRKNRAKTEFNKEELMKQLTSHLKAQCTHQEKMLDKISKILKPAQLAKFLLWVRKHGEVCIKIR